MATLGQGAPSTTLPASSAVPKPELSPSRLAHPHLTTDPFAINVPRIADNWRMQSFSVNLRPEPNSPATVIASPQLSISPPRPMRTFTQNVDSTQHGTQPGADLFGMSETANRLANMQVSATPDVSNFTQRYRSPPLSSVSASTPLVRAITSADAAALTQTKQQLDACSRLLREKDAEIEKLEMVLILGDVCVLSTGFQVLTSEIEHSANTHVQPASGQGRYNASRAVSVGDSDNWCVVQKLRAENEALKASATSPSMK